MAKLGWIGLGRIGTPMALRLLAAGHDLTAFDIAPESLSPVVAKGARAARSPADASDGAEAVLLCVSDTAAVERAVFGPDGAATRARPGALLIDHSTTHPVQTREMARRARDLGLCWIDAPISGGPPAAATGTLTAWLGGDAAEAARARTLVECYGRKISYMGPSGSGQVAKSCNQAIVANTIAVWAEMLRYAVRNGLDPLELIDTLEGSSADSNIRRTFAPDMTKGEFPPLSTRNMTKDLGIIADLAQASGTPMPISTLSLEAFRTGIASNIPAASKPGTA